MIDLVYENNKVFKSILEDNFDAEITIHNSDGIHPTRLGVEIPDEQTVKYYEMLMVTGMYQVSLNFGLENKMVNGKRSENLDKAFSNVKKKEASDDWERIINKAINKTGGEL